MRNAKQAENNKFSSGVGGEGGIPEGYRTFP